MRLLLAVLALTACDPVTPPPESTPPPSPAGACNAAPAQGLVGRQASPRLAAEAQRLSGARVWRWLRPGQMVTMEFRADRLNLRLDAGDKVEGITCG
jgi:hypothetical protein